MKKMGMIILVSTLALGLGAQEITEKKDLTIFDISYFKSDLDLGVVKQRRYRNISGVHQFRPVQCYWDGIPLGRGKRDRFR
jgi:hypothetical protein